MNSETLTSLVLCVALGGAAGAPSEGFAVGPVLSLSASESTVAPLATWRAQPQDNICGLRDLAQLSSPAKVDFERCLVATPELKRMKKEGIRPQSPEGIQLRTEAVDRVTRAANLVREAGGYCSVWKAIEHQDGRRIPDLTSRVVGQY
jgi:hypothetical protein